MKAGALKYEIFNETNNSIVETVTLEAGGKNGVIEPQTYHKVTMLSDTTSFYIEFHGIADVTVPAFIKDAKDVTWGSKLIGGNGAAAAAMGFVVLAGLTYGYWLRRKK